MNNRKAFTLIEVIVILAVIGILAGLAVPAALRLFEVTAEETTRQEMDNIKRAFLGDARKLQSSFRSDFGYIGDIGCLPDDLQRIFTNSAPPLPSALPTWTFDSTKQTGAGWKGPYISGAASGQETDVYTKDEWGSSYTYTPAGGACPLTATLTSPAANIASATDDITISILAGETTATVRGTVKDTTGVGLGSISVQFHSAANNGNLTTTTATTDANGNYTFISAPFGQRSVQADVNLVLVAGSITVTGGNNNNVNFQVRNYSGSAVTVNSINVACGAGVTDYATVQFDNQNVDPAGEQSCGGTHTLTGSNLVFGANPTPLAPLRVTIDSPDTQLPDLTARGGGTTRTVELIDFENGNPDVDMRNRTITVTFGLVSGGSAVITFTTPP